MASQTQKTCDKYLIVAAIDFGTTYSGYAFSTKEDFKLNPLKVYAKVWNAGSACLLSHKTSTCILFDPKKRFHSFGFTAEDKYSDLAYDEEHKDWYFFKRFKMTLFDKMQLKKKFMLEEEMGKKLLALDVFTECIAFMKREVMSDVRNKVPEIDENDIKWVITVPAIWNDNSKQFMREATEKAGIPGDHLMIALEPEAASLCCRFLPMNTFKGCNDAGLSPFAQNQKYLIFDAGGGTIDITVHQVQSSGGLKELYKATGGSWGGTYVDQSFRELLTDIFGNDIFDNFAANNTDDFMALSRRFEVKKRNIKNDMEERFKFSLPIALTIAFKEEKGIEIKDFLDNSPKYKGKINWFKDGLRMEAAAAKALFRDAIESIARHLQQLFRDERVRDVPTILMVGGFSESPMLQDMVKEKFPNKKIIIPTEASLSVLKGAVIFGHDPSLIEERRCRFTYGVMSSIKFDPKIHPQSKKFLGENEEEYCRQIFDKHVEIGQPVVFGETQNTQSYSPTKINQTQIQFEIYASAEKFPQFVTDSCCERLGELTIDLEGSGLDRSVEVQMCFSGTEMKVSAVEKKTGNTKQAKVNFLG